MDPILVIGLAGHRQPIAILQETDDHWGQPQQWPAAWCEVPSAPKPRAFVPLEKVRDAGVKKPSKRKTRCGDVCYC